MLSIIGMVPVPVAAMGRLCHDQHTRREDLHAMPWRRSAADAGGGGGLSRSGAGVGVAGRDNENRTHLSLQELRRGLRVCSPGGRACGGRGASSGYLFRLGLRDGFVTNEKNQGTA